MDLLRFYKGLSSSVIMYKTYCFNSVRSFVYFLFKVIKSIFSKKKFFNVKGANSKKANTRRNYKPRVKKATNDKNNEQGS